MKKEHELEYEFLKFGEEKEEVTDDNKENEFVNHILKANISNFTNGLQVESVIESLKKEFYIIPKFQRRFVWKKNQVANLALSIIKDVPIPPLYLYRHNRKEVILDGQQRVTAMFLYFNNLWYRGGGKNQYEHFDFKEIARLNSNVVQLEKELEVLKESKKDKEKLKQLKNEIKSIYDELKDKHGMFREKYFVDNNGKEIEITFSGFDNDEQEFLLRKRIDITIVECKTPNAQRVYADIFKLLNSGGKLLGAQEIRNGIYWELPLYEDLFNLNKNKNWRQIYGNESLFSKDVELLLKMLSLNYFATKSYEKDLETGAYEETLNISFNGTFNWSNIMEEYSEISSTWDEAKEKEEISRLQKFLDNIQGIETSERKCNKAVFEAVFVAVCQAKVEKPIDFEWLCSLEKEEEFKKGNVLSNKKSVQMRLNKALKRVRENFNV